MFKEKIKDSYSLAISIADHLVSILVYDTEIKQKVFHEQKPYTDSSQLHSIIKASTTGFSNTSISLLNDKFTIIPSSLTGQESLETIWKLNYGNHNSKIEQEEFKSLHSIILSNPPCIRKTFEGYHFLNNHSQSFFTLRYLSQTDLGESIIFLKKYESNIHLFVMLKGNLLLANHYPYEHSKDICYFTLLAAEKRDIDLENTTLYYVDNQLGFLQENEILSDYIAQIKQHSFDPHFDLIVQTQFT